MEENRDWYKTWVQFFTLLEKMKAPSGSVEVAPALKRGGDTDAKTES